MNTYQMSINHYSGAIEYFEVEAKDKAEALVKAKEHVRGNTHFWGGNYFENTIKCVKKVQKGKGKK